MDLQFESTDEFEAALAQFPLSTQNRVMRKINTISPDNPVHWPGQLMKPVVPKLHSNLASSLYIMRVDGDIRIILVVDQDPLFDQVIITLLQIARYDDVDSEKAYKHWAKILYQDDLAAFEPTEALEALTAQ